MKIEGILQKDDYFYVTFAPNLLEKLLGYDKKIEKYMQTGRVHFLTRDPIYIDKEGKKLNVYNKIAEEINKFKRRQMFHYKEDQLHLNMN